MAQGKEKKMGQLEEAKVANPEFGTRSPGMEKNVSTEKNTSEMERSSQVSQLFKRGQEAVSEFSQDVAEKVEAYAGDTGQSLIAAVKANPMRSLLVGFGIGCLAGTLLSRR